MFETVELIVLIAIEKGGISAVLLAGFFLLFCYGTSEIFNSNTDAKDNDALGIGFIGTVIMLYYFYNSYDLDNSYARAQWIMYFNIKSITGY